MNNDTQKVDVVDRIVDAALDVMVRLANSTDAYATYAKADILNTIATDPLGGTARYFAQLIALGIEWMNNFRAMPELLEVFGNGPSTTTRAALSRVGGDA